MSTFYMSTFFRKERTETEKVKCETCKHWIDKEDAQVVEIFEYFLNRFKVFYCPIHKVPYSRVQRFRFSPDIFFEELVVDKNGEPIGYVKAESVKRKEK